MRRRLFGSRRRKVFSALLATLLLGAGSAVAAFLIFNGVSGSGNGSFTNTTSTVPAFTIGSVATPVLVPGGASEAFPLTVKNEDTSASHQLKTLTVTSSSSVPGCDSYIEFDGATGAGTWSGLNNSLPLTVAAGATDSTAGANVRIQAKPTAPLACAGATWTINFGGTSQ